MSQVARRGFLLFVAALTVVAASSCRREAPSNIDRNKPPETYITRAPAESTLAYYRVHYYWAGLDRDGSIAYYEIAVTDSNEIPGADLEEGSGYTRTLKTDSVFVLKADPPIEQQVLGHRFYVRAIDNEGKADPTPAMAYFAAKNDYYPEVRFRPGRGWWVDRDGVTRQKVLTGGSITGQTDTIGVGGTASWTWGGFDLDPGGSVVGYTYKLGTQVAYRGGTAADTALEVTFPRNAARRQLLQVRAIDDGGLRSMDDFVRSVVLNFDPVTWVINPDLSTDEGNPVHSRVFREISGTQYWPSGTTLPDGSHQLEICFTGFDDPRDTKTSPTDPGITEFQTRVLSRDNSFGTPGGTAYATIAGSGYPARNRRQYYELSSGDHFILIRCRDDLLVVDSTPETVLVRVNYPPYFVKCGVRPSSAPAAQDIDLLSRNWRDVITIRLPADDSLTVTLLGRDVHRVNPGSPPDPDSLAAAYDSSQVVQAEQGVLDADEAYRAFLSTAYSEPGYDMAPGGDVTRAYTIKLAVPPGEGEYRLYADVKDLPQDAGPGRRGRVVRTIRIVR